MGIAILLVVDVVAIVGGKEEVDNDFFEFFRVRVTVDVVGCEL
jgi:hypothetical protein